MILVDTSVWIEVFRRGARRRLEDLVDLEEVVTVLPVVQEVLQGFRDPEAFRTAKEAMLALPTVDSPLPAARFLEAAELYRTARQKGYTVRSSTDCLIAACAIGHDLPVLHHHRDFDQLARFSRLEARRL